VFRFSRLKNEWTKEKREREIDLKVNNNKKKTITQMYKPQNKIENKKKRSILLRPFFNNDLSVYNTNSLKENYIHYKLNK
jgi:hypothetical protein